MNLLLSAIKKKKLKKNELREICVLKNSFWKYGISKQLKWFDKFVKSNDINVLLKNNNKIVGYALLRKRTIFFSKKKEKYLLFDTLIINKKIRRSGLAKLMVNFVNILIIKEGKIGILNCVPSLVKYYLSLGWIKLHQNKIKIIDHKINQISLIYNKKIKKNNFNEINIYTRS